MRWRSVGETNCSVARTLAVIGERWTMLILREAFMGHRRFDEFQRNTGIARNILASRLRALVSHGILERSENEGDHARVEYRLTKKGMDLYPVMVAMLRWGDRWLCGDKGPPLTLVHRGCGAKTTPALVCPNCGAPVGAGNPRAIKPLESLSAALHDGSPDDRTRDVRCGRRSVRFGRFQHRLLQRDLPRRGRAALKPRRRGQVHLLRGGGDVHGAGARRSREARGDEGGRAIA